MDATLPPPATRSRATARPQPLRARLAVRAWLRRLLGYRGGAVTIRAKILLAFLLMSTLTGGLGLYAVRGIGVTGGLVVETFDNALMSINYARAAAADFAAMEAALARQGHHAGPERVEVLERRIEEAADLLAGDLEIAAERALSRHAVLAAGEVGRAVAAWQAARATMADDSAADAAAGWAALDRLADEVRERIDLLINHTAGDGFQHRQRAVATVTSTKRLNAAGVGLAVLLSAAVAVLLARRIMGPVSAASGAAKRIAAGELDTPIPAAGADELGALLAAMTVMRDNIRAMMALEVAERRSAQGRLVDAIEGSREGVMLVDGGGRIAICNSQFARFFPALGALLAPGGSVAAVAAAARTGRVFADPDAADLLLGERDATREERLSDGRWVRVSRSATREGGFVALCSDVTPLKEREAELEATNRRFDAALSNMSQGLSMFDADRRLRVANRRFGEVYGVDPDRMPPGTPLRDILAMKVEAGHHAGQDVEDVLGEAEAFIRRRESGMRFRNLAGGRVVAVSHEPMADGGWVATHEDITERRRAEAQLAFMARHDALTSLPNRALFRERMDQAIAQLGRDVGFGVLCLDLDHFKGVNDTLGHPVGDRLLQAVAERLLACVREVDTVARLGGDEFAVIQAGIERPEDAVELARRLVARLGEPFDLDGQQVVLGTSVGIALAPGDGAQADALLRNADTALYRAKLDGRATYRFFEADMDARLQARRMLELDLRRAVATGEFELYYQPLVQLESDRVCGFEALLRWRHPTRGMVSPAEFIPLAEETGLIVPMGEWALRRACAEATAWPDHVKIAVNVSPVQFKSPRLVESVVEALAASGLPSRRLELEITESTLLQDNESTLATLHRLRALGLRISMDDFGTGYSSLSYLRSFPFDKIKIDQSFIRDLSTQADSGAIVRAIAGLGATLGMRTTAEGVETPDQLRRLREKGCTEVQGYLFSPPRPAAEIPALIARLDAAAVAGA